MSDVMKMLVSRRGLVGKVVDYVRQVADPLCQVADEEMVARYGAEFAESFGELPPNRPAETTPEMREHVLRTLKRTSIKFGPHSKQVQRQYDLVLLLTSFSHGQLQRQVLRAHRQRDKIGDDEMKAMLDAQLKQRIAENRSAAAERLDRRWL